MTIFKAGDLVNYYPYGDRVFELVEHHNPVDYFYNKVEIGGKRAREYKQKYGGENE